MISFMGRTYGKGQAKASAGWAAGAGGDTACPVRTGRVWGGRDAPTAGGALVREQKKSPTGSGSEGLSGRFW